MHGEYYKLFIKTNEFSGTLQLEYDSNVAMIDPYSTFVKAQEGQGTGTSNKIVNIDVESNKNYQIEFRKINNGVLILNNNLKVSIKDN